MYYLFFEKKCCNKSLRPKVWNEVIRLQDPSIPSEHKTSESVVLKWS